MLEILARHSHRDYRLVLAGDGPLAATLDASAARRAPGRLLRLGAIDDRRELARCYASADVFVHPNPREPFGIGPLEAMASGVPVVVPDAGGVLSYANAENARLADDTGIAFATAVQAAAEEPDRVRLTRARETALTHEWSRIAARWFEFYDGLVRSRGGCHATLDGAPVPARPGPGHRPGVAANPPQCAAARHLHSFAVDARPFPHKGR